MRRMLNLRMVTQFAMLEDFDIFLVLADKVRDEDSNRCCAADDHGSHSLHTISEYLSLIHLGYQAPHRRAKSSARKTYNSSLSGILVAGYWSFL